MTKSFFATLKKEEADRFLSYSDAKALNALRRRQKSPTRKKP